MWSRESTDSDQTLYDMLMLSDAVSNNHSAKILSDSIDTVVRFLRVGRGFAGLHGLLQRSSLRLATDNHSDGCAGLWIESHSQTLCRPNVDNGQATSCRNRGLAKAQVNNGFKRDARPKLVGLIFSPYEAA